MTKKSAVRCLHTMKICECMQYDRYIKLNVNRIIPNIMSTTIYIIIDYLMTIIYNCVGHSDLIQNH